MVGLGTTQPWTDVHLHLSRLQSLKPKNSAISSRNPRNSRFVSMCLMCLVLVKETECFAKNCKEIVSFILYAHSYLIHPSLQLGLLLDPTQACFWLRQKAATQPALWAPNTSLLRLSLPKFVPFEVEDIRIIVSGFLCISHG